MSAANVAVDGSGAPASSPRRKSAVSVWIPVAILVVGAPLGAFGAVSLANYYVDHTSVTITSGAWAISPPGMTTTYYLAACGWGGATSCPGHVHPGAPFSTSFYLGGSYAGENLSLVVPAPFRLVSSEPSLPTTVPSSGIEVAVVLGLPTTGGQYSFLGTIGLDAA